MLANITSVDPCLLATKEDSLDLTPLYRTAHQEFFCIGWHSFTNTGPPHEFVSLHLYGHIFYLFKLFDIHYLYFDIVLIVSHLGDS